MKRLLLQSARLALALALAQNIVNAAPVRGWLDWRGASHLGVSMEKGLPDKVDAKAALWSADFPGQSSPVIANGKLYINGFLGEGPDLQEVVSCFDAETGKKLWEHRENDFLSDIIYLRYSTSSPSVDGETGNVYVQGTQGLLMCFSADGKLLWKHSLMEEYGRLTFPNARTASPIIDKDLVIMGRRATASTRSTRRRVNSSGAARRGIVRRTTPSRIRGSISGTANACCIRRVATARCSPSTRAQGNRSGA
jgi:hypothetical protein